MQRAQSSLSESPGETRTWPGLRGESATTCKGGRGKDTWQCGDGHSSNADTQGRRNNQTQNQSTGRKRNTAQKRKHTPLPVRVTGGLKHEMFSGKILKKNFIPKTKIKTKKTPSLGEGGSALQTNATTKNRPYPGFAQRAYNKNSGARHASTTVKHNKHHPDSPCQPPQASMTKPDLTHP